MHLLAPRRDRSLLGPTALPALQLHSALAPHAPWCHTSEAGARIACRLSSLPISRGLPSSSTGAASVACAWPPRHSMAGGGARWRRGPARCPRSLHVVRAGGAAGRRDGRA
eukprot:scaffold1455_cov65-Phaeocystis_antarctica.AAC.1